MKELLALQLLAVIYRHPHQLLDTIIKCAGDLWEGIPRRHIYRACDKLEQAELLTHTYTETIPRQNLYVITPSGTAILRTNVKTVTRFLLPRSRRESPSFVPSSSSPADDWDDETRMNRSETLRDIIVSEIFPDGEASVTDQTAIEKAVARIMRHVEKSW